MEPDGHPIPQDITGFQFRLIGDMTVKQFAYLAGGAILAWIFFSTPLPTILKIPFALGFGLFGVILAFMPIHGRPSDVMLMLFFKAIFKPNLFTYKKNVTTDTSPQANIPTSNTPTTTIPPLPEPLQASDISSANPVPTPAIIPSPPAPASPQPHPDPLLTGEGNQIPAGANLPVPTPTPLKKTPVIPADAINLIAGVIEDPRGNVLQNIIVEVKDTEGSPVRAFKTNDLGQFIAATPLGNGTYTVTSEDPDKRHQFTALTFTAKGEPIPPLEIKSMDQREQLRQSLFTPTGVPKL